MKKPSGKKYYQQINKEQRYNNINRESPLRLGKSYDNNYKKSENINFNTYNISSQNNNSRLLNLEKYPNISLSQSRKNNIDFNSYYPSHCPACHCPCIQPTYHTQCHIHHFHIPNPHCCPRLRSKEYQPNEELLTEVQNLKLECKKFKEELEKTKSENEIGNKYIKLLENKINLKEYDINDVNDNIENKYHTMLDKSFEVLNSVSNKCDDDKAKLKGNVNYYYSKKDNEYDDLIEAQKKWLDNLPEKYNKNNLYNNSTFSNTKEQFGDIDYDNSNYNDKYFNNMRNFNKTDINDLNNNNNNFINQYNNNNLDENKEPDLEEQIPQEDYGESEPEEENIINSNNNINTNNKIFEQNNNTDYYPNNQNHLKINNKIDQDDDNLEEKEEEINPLNERYLILDKNGQNIIIENKQLLGMKLIPAMGEDGKELVDTNGNVILIGPDGNPKSQDDLEPILLDDDTPLVNEENRPFIGFNGIPLINQFGEPILGPGELYDRDNKVVKGLVAIVPKDKYGNPMKKNLNEDKKNENNIQNDDNIINKEDNEDNNNDNINENNNNDNNTNFDFNKIRPLIGINGLPVRDSQNNFVFLDENNKPVKNTGLYLLLDPNGKPVLNSQSKPILINSQGKPINLIDNDINNIPKNNHIINSMMNPNYPNENINNNGNNDIDNNKKNFKGYIKTVKPKTKIINKKNNNNKLNNKFNNNYNNRHNDNYNKNIRNRKILEENERYRNKRDKGKFTYSEINSEEVKKIDFLNNSAEYKGNCFACDVGCSVSKSGYSPMNYVPYNNIIRRREVTPLKNKRKISKYENDYENNYAPIEE